MLLSTVFGMSTPSGTISWATYQKWAQHPAVKWTIPYALGDAHKGHRVIGTTADFFTRYRFRNDSVTFTSGAAPADEHAIAIGSDVAERLGYSVGDSIVLSHGVAAISFAEHEAHPFIVSGVIARTFTPIDRSLYVTLAGLEAMHEEEEGAGGLAMGPPAPEHAPGEAPITSFLVGTKNRFETLTLQREMNEDRSEPLTAVIPGVALGQLWQTIGSAEVGLRVVALFTVLVGLIGMCVALYASLESRRREMAILRAVGAGPRTVVSLLVLESGLLALLGAVTGVVVVYAGLALARGGGGDAVRSRPDAARARAGGVGIPRTGRERWNAGGRTAGMAGVSLVARGWVVAQVVVPGARGDFPSGQSFYVPVAV